MWDTSAPAEKSTPAGLEPAWRRACPATHSMKFSKNAESNAGGSRRAKKSKKSKKTRPRFKLADAMREIGLDELKVAKTMNRLINDLAGSPKNEKLLLDAVKESIRVLDPGKTTLGTGAPDGPVAVILEHSVPLPDRSCP
jgi:hypothetical protein